MVYVLESSPHAYQAYISVWRQAPASITYCNSNRNTRRNATMMKTVVLLALFSLVICEKQQQQFIDPFAALDKHISHAFSYHYLWPWNQLMKAAAVLDDDAFDEPQIISDSEKFTIKMRVKRFKPEELKVRVKNKNIIVEGKHKLDNDNRFMANHFVQRFVLPAGCKQEEVTAVLKNDNLIVSVPKHDVPPPPPEREVPIEVIEPPTTEKPEDVPEKKTEKPKKPVEVKPTEGTITEETVIEDQKVKPIDTKVEPVVTTSALEQLDTVEATTHVGKIRKKELKENKTAKDNEVTKTEITNGLDYTLLETE